MHENIIYIIPTLLLAAFVILMLTGDRKKKEDVVKSRVHLNESKMKPEDSKYYIQPAEFEVGLVEQPIYKSSNLCNDTVLKPIIPVNVDYGWKMPENCPCTKYIEAP